MVTDTERKIWELISVIPDPEIPVITIADLGILREVRLTENQQCIILLSPTYMGCPALDQIQKDITNALEVHHIRATFQIEMSPAWTTETIPPEALERLRVYGIAPPLETVNCPRCHSGNVIEISFHGSTSCKSLYRCQDCLEPFDYFKPH